MGSVLLRYRSPLMAQSGHSETSARLSAFGAKRTCGDRVNLIRAVCCGALHDFRASQNHKRIQQNHCFAVLSDDETLRDGWAE